MENNKIHIDSLFFNGLKNLEIAPSLLDINRAMENIENLNLKSFENVFKNFELPINNTDWLIVKERLEKQKTSTGIPLSSIGIAFNDFEIAITNSDWTATKNKLNNAQGKGKKKILWWWLNIAIIGTVAIISSQLIKNKSQVNIKLKVTSINSESTNLLNNPDQNTLTETSNSSNNKIDLLTKSQKINYNIKVNKEIFNINNIESSKAKGESIGSVNLNSTFAEINNANFNNSNFNNEFEKSDLDAMESLKIKYQRINLTTINSFTPIDILKSDTAKKRFESKYKPKLPNSKINYFIGLNTQMAETYRALSKSNNSTYNSIRNSAEKPFTQFSYGVASGFQKGKNQIQIGGQFTQQNWTSNYNYSYKIFDSLPVRNTSGQIIGYFLTRGRDTTINESQTIIIKKIDIPFSYNYTQMLNSKTNLIFGFGGVIGINTKRQGTKIINPSNNYLYSYNALKKNENKLSFSPQLTLGVQRNLTKNLLVQTNIFANYAATSRFKSQFGAKDNPYSFGLSLKLLFLLN
ncbi:MAG: hypothetical protein HQ463_05340 [Bacteroidetes bacterium]|nr:hypothetical protein [Bacteroidota bacterium]